MENICVDMAEIARAVLAGDAGLIRGARQDISGRSCGRVICEALAEAAMGGEIKASQLLMELAGEDVKSRELKWKHGQTERAAAPIILDSRPEEA